MRIENFSRFTMFSVIGSVTLMPLLVLPAMIGVLVDQANMSESLAGWSASLNFLGAAAIGLLISLRIHHLNLRQIGTLALALAVVADLASAFMAGPTTAFLVVRTIAGVVLGAAYVAAVSSFARYDGYERGFGIFVTLQFTISGLGLYLVPVFSDELGARGLFVVFAMLDILALFLARHLPDEIAAIKEHRESKSELRVLFTLAAILAIVGFSLFEAANNAQFTYIERFGVSLDISEHRIGIALLVASLIGISGAFTIVVIGHRFGTIGPLTLGITIAISGLLILLGAETYFWYFMGGCFMGFSWAYCLPYIQSLLASLDRNGTAIAAGTSFSTLGSAIGPGFAALIVGGGKYGNVFTLSIALFVVACVCFFYASRHRDATRAAVSR
jgi:predicted MFS family arabinose efflux permease